VRSEQTQQIQGLRLPNLLKRDILKEAVSKQGILMEEHKVAMVGDKEQFKMAMVKIVSDKFDIPLADVKTDALFMEDLGADSLDMVEMMVFIEEALGVFVPDDQVGECVSIDTTVNILLPFVEQRRMELCAKAS
jgi:Acyl carrier protein|tara:strand:+ start:8595 stop:8996 length:402 start_codon:yes stop_codon:yes gene_type:complete